MFNGVVQACKLTYSLYIMYSRLTWRFWGFGGGRGDHRKKLPLSGGSWEKINYWGGGHATFQWHFKKFHQPLPPYLVKNERSLSRVYLYGDCKAIPLFASRKKISTSVLLSRYLCSYIQPITRPWDGLLQHQIGTGEHFDITFFFAIFFFKLFSLSSFTEWNFCKTRWKKY